jgi:hypothetical protein
MDRYEFTRLNKTIANINEQASSNLPFNYLVDSEVDSEHHVKLLSLVIHYEQTVSLNELARTPANVCRQAGRMVHIPLFGSVSTG